MFMTRPGIVENEETDRLASRLGATTTFGTKPSIVKPALNDELIEIYTGKKNSNNGIWKSFAKKENFKPLETLLLSYCH